MPTLRALLDTADGLYRDVSGGTSYLRDDLVGQLSDGVLSRKVTLCKTGFGTYRIMVDGVSSPSYDLYSRRRTAR